MGVPTRWTFLLCLGTRHVIVTTFWAVSSTFRPELPIEQFLGHQPGNENGQIELARNCFRSCKRSGNGMYRRNIPVPQGCESNETEVCP